VWLNDCFDYYIGYFKCQPGFDFISVNVSIINIFYLSLQSSLFSSLFFPYSFPFSFFPSSTFCTRGNRKKMSHIFSWANRHRRSVTYNIKSYNKYCECPSSRHCEVQINRDTLRGQDFFRIYVNSQ
jgi:hypothetical protein